ncbi:MAG: methyltransferase domain-containing protein [Defluviitaleaceae bacterium]|nr:methyltransferase domain-containing protein [Defluviitaleaceae bacterium]
MSDNLSQNTNNSSLENLINEFIDGIADLFNAGHYELISELCIEFLEKFKDDRIYALLASAKLAIDDIEAAEKASREGIALNPENPDHFINLACILSINGSPSNAARSFLRAKKLGMGSLDDVCDEEISKLSSLISKPINELIPDKAKKRVLVIAAIFPPLSGSGVQRTLKLVKYLRFFDWEPVVITYPISDNVEFHDYKYLDELPNDIEIIRIPFTPKDTPDVHIEYLKQKLLPLLSQNTAAQLNQVYEIANWQQRSTLVRFPEPSINWAYSVAEYIEKHTNMSKIDMIYSTSGPYSNHFAGYYIKKRFNKPWVVDFRDEWSNNPVLWVDNKAGISYQMCLDCENKILKSADHVICVTEKSLENYKKLGVSKDKVSCITNGFDEEDFEGLADSSSQNEKFTLIHNGLLYRDRSPKTILQAIKNLINRNEIDADKIIFYMGNTMGYGKAQEDQITEEVAKLGLEKIAFQTPYMEHRESLNHAFSANLLIIILGSNQANDATYPAKIFEYLRLGKPILSLAPSNSVMESLLKKNTHGVNVHFDDIASIEKEILRYYNAWLSGDTLTHQSDISAYERRNLVSKHAAIFDAKKLNTAQKTNNAMDMLKLAIALNAQQEFDKSLAAHKKAIRLEPTLSNIKKSQKVNTVPKYDEYDTSCIGCNSVDIVPTFVCNQSISADNYGVLNPIRVWKKCNECGLVFAGNMPSSSALDKYYAAHFKEMQAGGKMYAISETGNQEGYFRYSENRINRIERIRGSKGSLLDIGAGLGTFVKVASDHGWQTYGLEFSSERVNYAKEKWGISLKQMDFFDLESKDQYDVITMFEVIEHLINPWEALEKCASLLKEKGVFVIATPFRDSTFVKARHPSNDFWWNEPSHLSYMDTQTLVKASQKYGFNCVEIVDSEDGAGRLEVYLQAN